MMRFLWLHHFNLWTCLNLNLLIDQSIRHFGTLPHFVRHSGIRHSGTNPNNQQARYKLQACQMASAQLKTECTPRYFILRTILICCIRSQFLLLKHHNSTLIATMMWCPVLPPVHRDGSGDLIGFCVLSAANQPSGCKSLTYFILLSTSLMPKPNQWRYKGLMKKAKSLKYWSFIVVIYATA